MSLIWPNGSTSIPRVTSEFNPNRKHPISGAMRPHRGIDLAGWSSIVAPAAGVVTTVGWQAGGAGHYVNMRADDGTVFKFFHLAAKSQLRVGQRIARGAVIGRMGATGGATGVHLHFEVWEHGRAVNPRSFYARHQSKPAPAPTPTPAAPVPEEDDDMAKNSGFYYKRSDGVWAYLVLNAGSGFVSEYVGGSSGAAVPASYNNAVAKAFDTGNWAPISESHANALKRAAGLVLDKTISGDLTVTINEAEVES